MTQNESNMIYAKPICNKKNGNTPHKFHWIHTRDILNLKRYRFRLRVNMASNYLSFATWKPHTFYTPDLETLNQRERLISPKEFTIQVRINKRERSFAGKTGRDTSKRGRIRAKRRWTVKGTKYTQTKFIVLNKKWTRSAPNQNATTGSKCVHNVKSPSLRPKQNGSLFQNNYHVTDWNKKEI